jgi:transcriptional regulator with XRE-family HTH domain
VTGRPAPCTATIHDGHETVRCVLGGHDDTEDHRHGFLGWDNAGTWYARRDFPDLYPAVGAVLREARKARGLTQQQVAASVNLTRSSIANIESGRQHLPLHSWVGICQVLGVDPAGVISRAVQGAGPLAEPLPSRGDRQTAQLCRRLEAAQAAIAALITDLTTRGVTS